MCCVAECGASNVGIGRSLVPLSVLKNQLSRQLPPHHCKERYDDAWHILTCLTDSSSGKQHSKLVQLVHQQFYSLTWTSLNCCCLCGPRKSPPPLFHPEQVGSRDLPCKFVKLTCNAAPGVQFSTCQPWWGIWTNWAVINDLLFLPSDLVSKQRHVGNIASKYMHVQKWWSHWKTPRFYSTSLNRRRSKSVSKLCSCRCL